MDMEERRAYRGFTTDVYWLVDFSRVNGFATYYGWNIIYTICRVLIASLATDKRYKLTIQRRKNEFAKSHDRLGS